MINVTNLSLNFSGTNLFAHCDLKFTEGNCYGIIGANGAGKSTFLKILAGKLTASTGDIDIKKNTRMSVLEQNHYAYDEYSVLDTIIMGNRRLYEIMKHKDILYDKEDFSDEDGILVSELEDEFSKLNGWEAESEASRILTGLGVDIGLLNIQMNELDGKLKVKVLLAQALFGSPDILLMDEPTNNLDIASIEWLENYLLDFPGTVIVVSHDRQFLNTVCTHIVDIDYSEIHVYVGNYDFWYESSQMIQKMKREQNKKDEDKAKELKSFIERFSANKSKAKQATSRKKLLDKLNLEDLPQSSRRYPFIGFQMARELGKDILTVDNISKSVNGEQVLKNISFRVNNSDKIAFVGSNETSITTLFKILMGEIEPDSGTFKWGVSTSQSYFPKDNSAFFDNCELSILKWLEQYSKDITETYLRGFLGRMLFSGDDVLKPVCVLSGGERVRCMFSKMMICGSNVLILDQPTNHLDLESITAVNNGLMDFRGVLLFSSYDHQFIQTIANRIIEIKTDTLVDRLSTFDEYIEYTGTLKK
jgi:ATPase subunit of ABC transporter with duplicated ATPase domains